jgi:integrase/recombinase XerC
MEREGINQLDEIDQRVVRLFLTDLYHKQLSRRSVSRTISCLRSFYKFMERERVVDNNPFVQIRLPKASHPIPDFLYKEELAKLFEISDLSDPLGQRNQAIIETLYATGIRVGECQGLVLEDIDFSIGSMFIRGKGRKERYVLFGQFAEEALQTYINHGRNTLLKNKQPTNSVFLNSRGQPLTTRGIRHILTTMVEKAALTVQVNPHKLRHTFATHMLNEGADLRTVQELLGHENLSSTQIYTHVTKDHLRNIYMNSHPRANNDMK